MKQSPRCAPSTPGRTARGVAATCPAWDRVTAGANPAALTNFIVGQCVSPVSRTAALRRGIIQRYPNPLSGNNTNVNDAKGLTPGLGVIREEQAGMTGTLQ